MESMLDAREAALEFAIGHKLKRSAKPLPRQTQRRLFLAALIVSDSSLLVAALTLAYLIRFYSPLPFRDDVMPRPDFYLQLGLALIPLWLILFWVYGLYNWDKLFGGTQEYAALFQASVAGAIVIAVSQFVFEELIIARGWVGLVWGLVFLMLVVGRFLMRRLGYALRRSGYLVSPALLLGANDEGRLLAQQILTWPTSGLNVLGFLDNVAPVGTRVCGPLYVLGRLDQLDERVEQYRIEELVLATSALSRDHILDIFKRYGAAPQVHLRLSSGLFELLTTGLQVKELACVPLIGVNRVRLTGTDVILKTSLDYALTIVGLTLLAPVLLFIAILVKLDSPGPVLHRRRVMGLNGRTFDALKFRTMRIDGDALLAANPALQRELALTHKLKVDPRITRLGRVLRKYSLDELPQLINVLKGDMSLVGPRMISPPELGQYGQWGMNLLTVRPGLSVLWQVSGRSDVSYEDRVRLDMHYIRNYSIWLDIQIICQTIPVVLFGTGAY